MRSHGGRRCLLLWFSPIHLSIVPNEAIDAGQHSLCIVVDHGLASQSIYAGRIMSFCDPPLVLDPGKAAFVISGPLCRNYSSLNACPGPRS